MEEQVKKQIDKNKIIAISAIILIVIGIISLSSGIANLNRAIQLDTFYGLEPIKTTTIASQRVDGYEDVFSIVTGELGSEFNPIFATTEGEKIVAELVFEPLFKRDATGELKRRLAENIYYTNEDKTILIDLKEDVLFSDGSKVTTEDVENALLFHCYENGVGSNNVVGVAVFRANPSGGLSGISVNNDNQIEIKFTKYDVDNELILETLIQKSSHIAWDFSRDFMEDVRTYLGDGIGSYGYELIEKESRYAVLGANPHFREENAGIEFVSVYHESATEISEWLDDQIIDMVTVNRESGYYNGIYNNDNMNVYSSEMLPTLSLVFNSDNYLTKNNALRESIHYALDRDALIEVEEISRFIPVSSMLPKNGFSEAVHSTTSNISKATELLNQAKEELKLETITLYLPIVSGNEMQQAISSEIKAQLDAIGVNINIESLTLSDYMQAIYIEQRYSLYIDEINGVSDTYSVKDFYNQYFINRDFPIDTQLEFVVFARGDEEKQSAYEALDKALLQESVVVPFARVQDFRAVSNYWDNITILPNKNAPHDLHLVTKK